MGSLVRRIQCENSTTMKSEKCAVAPRFAKSLVYIINYFCVAPFACACARACVRACVCALKHEQKIQCEKRFCIAIHDQKDDEPFHCVYTDDNKNTQYVFLCIYDTTIFIQKRFRKKKLACKRLFVNNTVPR